MHPLPLGIGQKQAVSARGATLCVGEVRLAGCVPLSLHLVAPHWQMFRSDGLSTHSVAWSPYLALQSALVLHSSKEEGSGPAPASENTLASGVGSVGGGVVPVPVIGYAIFWPSKIR